MIDTTNLLTILALIAGALVILFIVFALAAAVFVTAVKIMKKYQGKQ